MMAALGLLGLWSACMLVVTVATVLGRAGAGGGRVSAEGLGGGVGPWRSPIWPLLQSPPCLGGPRTPPRSLIVCTEPLRACTSFSSCPVSFSWQWSWQRVSRVFGFRVFVVAFVFFVFVLFWWGAVAVWRGSGPQEVGRPSVSTLSPFSLVPLPSPHPCSQDCRTGGASRLLLPPPPLPRTDSEMSRELLVLKTELWNGEGGTRAGGHPGVRVGVGGAAAIKTCPLRSSVSTLVRECQKEQNQGWSSVRQLVTEAKQDINVVKRDVQTEGDKVKTLSGGALADLHWAEFVSRWVLGNWGRGQQGSHSPRAQGFKGTMDVTP